MGVNLVELPDKLCARCLMDVDKLYPAPCNHDPSKVVGPIGQYHCPVCGTMLIAGSPHFEICGNCVSELTEDGLGGEA